jgi:protein-disulfide isomerase
MADLEKEVVKEIKKEEKMIKKFILNKANIWMSVSIILIIVLAGVLFWPQGISKSEAENLVSAYAVYYGASVSVVDSIAKDNFYIVNVSYQGQEIPFYVSKDGKYVGQMADVSSLDLDSSGDSPNSDSSSGSDSVSVPKSDKPKVELFVWSYCPYGVAAQGPLAEVANLLSSDADFEIVPYYDGHGAYETQQNKIQLCVQKNSPNLYWDYAAEFVKTIYPKCGATRDIDCDKTESLKLMNSLGINSKIVMDCVASEGDNLFNAAAAKAQSNGVSGSPTLTVNGVVVQTARNAEAYKTAICNAFNTAPGVCSEVLSSASATASGNC